jgi:phosphatidylethanolamine/phosphatidyl-N-methylethanolamine N-methyltransferase
MINKRLFFKKFLDNPRRTGSVIQSSPFLVGQMVKPVDFRKAKIIVEFGAGTGVVTKKILKNMSEEAILLCFEVNKDLCKELKEKVQDSRLKIVPDGAEKLGRYLKRYNIKKVDCVISGLPLVVLPKEIGEKVLIQIHDYLKEGGQYVQFQYSLTSRKKFKKMFSAMEVRFTLLNIPPAFVYVCTK